MAWLTILLAVPFLLASGAVINTSLCLLRNYRIAKTIDVPIHIVPISPFNHFWALVDRNTSVFLRRLPFGDNSITRYNWREWEVKDRYRSHAEMGDIWVLVTPSKNRVYLNDPEAISRFSGG